MSVRKKKPKEAEYTLLWIILYINRRLLDKHRYEWATVLDFQYAKNKNATPTKVPNECYFLKSAFTSVGGEDTPNYSSLLKNISKYRTA